MVIAWELNDFIDNFNLIFFNTFIVSSYCVKDTNLFSPFCGYFDKWLAIPQ